MIVSQLLLVSALPLLWPSAAMPLTPGSTGRALATPDGDGGRVLQRSKRGWMWNQFFLLEEYTGNDHQYVGKVTRGWLMMCTLTAVTQWRVCDVASCQESDRMDSSERHSLFSGLTLLF